MKEKNNPSADIPAYLAGTLGESEKRDLEEALARSRELRNELDLWRKLRVVMREQAVNQAQGHLSPETILELAEGRRSGAEAGSHLRTCADCRDDVEKIRSTYPTRSVAGRERRSSFLPALPELFTMPRIGYALGILITAIVIASGIMYYLAHKGSEWRRLQAQGDSMMEQGRSEEARVLYQRAWETRDPNDLQELAGASASLDSLAIINLRAGETTGAQALLEQSLALKDSAGMNDTWQVAWINDQLGNIQKIAGNDLSAEALFRKADAIREELARLHPQDQDLQRYRRNVALIRLVPQTGFRGPETPPFPSVDFDQATTHAEFLIVLRRNRDISSPYLVTLTSPSRSVLPIPDTLSVDPLHPEERTLRLTLSSRFFEEGKGTYRIGVRKPGSDFEDVYFFQVPSL